MALPTQEEAETLVKFLPEFSVPGRAFVKRWHGGHDEKGGVIEWSFPEYDDDVQRFFGIVATSSWAGRDSRNDRTEHLVSTPEQLIDASIEEVCDVLTYCWRGERFCDGHQGSMLDQGVVQAALGRLGQLIETLGVAGPGAV
jgi:hypothetical protein